MTNIRKIAALTGLVLTLSLGGCWNDDNSDNAVAVPASSSVPDSAGASSAAFVAYLQTLSSSDETSQPLTISGSFAVPADETSAPTLLK